MVELVETLPPRQTSGDAREAYLLDLDYKQDTTEDDRAVREALLELGRVTDAHSNSAGHKAVKDLLEQLGYRSGRQVHAGAGA